MTAGQTLMTQSKSLKTKTTFLDSVHEDKVSTQRHPISDTTLYPSHGCTLKPQIITVLALQPEEPVVLPEFPNISLVAVSARTMPSSNLEVVKLLHQLCVAHRPVLVLSFGNRAIWNEKGVGNMPFNFRRRWIHVSSPSELTEASITSLYLSREDAYDDTERGEVKPLVSVITSTYKSGERLQRAYQSLVTQTYDHWEWVLWDDSPADDNGATFQMLQDMMAQDMRLRVFKAPDRSGSIGEMKLRVASLAMGDWIVELDHDDRVHPQLFQWVRDIALGRPATKFIYSDHAEVHEENDAPFTYGESYGYNHGSYMRQYIRTHPEGQLQPQFISRSPWANPVTMRHLVGLPNHVRIWNRAFYEQMGRHRPDLPVADDYDLLIKTYLHADPGEIVCIVAPSYFQYRNAGENNFTFKRNALIQHLVWYLHQRWYGALVEKYTALGWDSSHAAFPSTPVWEEGARALPDFYPRWEYYFVPEDQNPAFPCISIVIPTYKNIRGLELAIRSVVGQTYPNWKLFVVGDGCPELDRFALHSLPQLFPDHLEKITWYNLQHNHKDGGITTINYAVRMLVKSRWVTYVDDDQLWATEHLESLMEVCEGPHNVTYCHASMKSHAVRRRAGVLHRHDLTIQYGHWIGREDDAAPFMDRWWDRENGRGTDLATVNIQKLM